ncbi:MAG: endonuclease III domain-containing protein [Aquificae bacterium]|nr:endonuclease III domain-containing protein [Aquificota bacterium]
MLGNRKGALLRVYRDLLKYYGKQNWWPVDKEYHKKQKTDPREEIVIGALLVQNTSWKNAKKAIENLKRERALSLSSITTMEEEKLSELIKPAGYYRKKALYLKELSRRFRSADELSKLSRDELLKLRGIGKETADVILLYAFGKPHFVVDAYTKRLLRRLFGIEGSYEEIKELFEKELGRDTELFKEYHALIDVHAQTHCRKKPLCEGCPLFGVCGAS